MIADDMYVDPVMPGKCPCCAKEVTRYPWPEDASAKNIGEILLFECKHCGWAYRI
jgi:hypothetical protein